MFSMLLAALSPAAFPCAGLFHQSDLRAESGVQEIILEQGTEGVRAHYRVVYDGDSPDFGWVIPIPGDVAVLEDGDEAFFDTVRDRSAPLVGRVSSVESSGCACMGTLKSGGDSASDTASSGMNSVEVVGQGFTGTYDYSLLAATDAGELVSWLEENGWSVGDSEAELAAYVADGWTFAALKITPESAETAAGGTALPPVTVSYQGALAYPARMALGATLTEQRTTLYVIGDQRARLAEGWSEQPLQELQGSFEDDPMQLFEDALWAIGGDQAGYAVTWAGTFEDGWLTRFDTFAAREAHTADPVFALDGGEDSSSLYIQLVEGASGASSGRRSRHGFLLLLPLAGLGWSIRRR